MEIVLVLAALFVFGMDGPFWLKPVISLTLFITGLVAVCEVVSDQKKWISDWAYQNKESVKFFGLVFWGAVAYGGVALHLQYTMQIFYLGITTLLFFSYWASLVIQERKFQRI